MKLSTSCSQIIICPVQEQEINFGFALPRKSCLSIDFIICWHLFQRNHPSGVNEFNSLTARTSKRRAEAASSSSDANKASSTVKLSTSCSQIIICPVQEQEINFSFALPRKSCLSVDFIICWHLFQRIHPSGVNEFNSLTARTSKRRAEAASSSSDANKALKQTKLLWPRPKKDKSSVTQSKLTELVLNVITEAMLPFSFVKQPSFKELIVA